MISMGIDIGGSTTKIVGMNEKSEIIDLFKVTATDAVTSAFGAFGRFINENSIKLSEIKNVYVTGVGSSFLNDDIYGIKVTKSDEFQCIGEGGLYLTKLEEAIIVSMGTGTALVKAQNGKIEYLGGTGVGGGTLVGLSELMLNVRNVESISELAAAGDLSKIDLTIGDISKEKINILQPHATAANFGKVSDLASKSDIALGILNLVVQTAGMMAIFAARPNNIKDIVLTGNLSQISQINLIKDDLAAMFNFRFTVPDNSQYATAIGAALRAVKDK